MTYPVRAPRSVRRAYSRDEARSRTTIGIKGFRDGGSASEIVWKKHVPEVPTRSGQTRVNHKRNMRSAFVRLLAADNLTQISEELGLR
jgi:hypothetical protein